MSLSSLSGPSPEVRAVMLPSVARPPRTPRPAPVVTAESPRIAVLRTDGAAGFWQRVEAEGTPLAEEIAGDPGHRAVTFLWRGGEGVRSVLALPNKVADPRDPRRNHLARVPVLTSALTGAAG